MRQLLTKIDSKILSKGGDAIIVFSQKLIANISKLFRHFNVKIVCEINEKTRESEDPFPKKMKLFWESLGLIIDRKK